MMKGITKRGDKYRVNASANGTRVTATVPTLEEARDARLLMKAELCITRDGKTLQDAFDQAVLESWSRAKTEASKKTSIKTALLALRYFGKSTPITDINRTDIAAYDDHLRATGNTDATINRKMSALSRMLRVAHEHGWIQGMPKIQFHPEGEGRTRYLSIEEERAILTLCDTWGKKDHSACIQVLIDTGMRPGELFSLEKRDVNFVENLVHIFENKTSVPRSIPMTKRTHAILFTRTVTQNRPFPYDNDWLHGVWDRIRVTMGLQQDKEFVPYCCRHTCATRLLQGTPTKRGLDLIEIQRWLGHKHPSMTMRYAHLAPTALRRGAALLEQEEKHETPDTHKPLRVDDVDGLCW